MKQIYSIITLLLFSLSIFGQAPQKMSYQAVIRNGGNALVASTPVGMKISILQGSTSGTAVYVETQTPRTNTNGLVSIEIGSGTAVTGTFSGINWANGPFFIKTETDPNGGTVYSITGTNELTSVPYALHSANGRTVHTIGENYGGGTVFYVREGGQHGLIVSNSSLGPVSWSNGINKSTGTSLSTGLNAGAMNTILIVTQQIADNPAGNFAAKACADFEATSAGVSYGDWYLPSTGELTAILLNKAFIGGTIANSTATYWSSNEESATDASSLNFQTGKLVKSNKATSNSVLAVRAF